MGFVLIAIYTGSQLAYQGAVIQMIAHGLSAAGLFILCGQLYERIHTRDMRMMGRSVEQDEMAASTVAVLCGGNAWDAWHR
ncbi:NADH dehydrogenase I subunit M [Escherichia coli]|uniref:NADH dehydrogenase I subunit M n=1 Tax=Escherichia coli TaxID=562 RepID=A0A377BU78_ECOLX|nr:NADH dehydrogenase I subunit M [Escherichia coli]